MIESGITSDKLLACVKNYVKMLDDGSISSVWAISNFFGQKAYWKRYIYNFPQALLEAWKDALCIVEWKPIELENLKKLVDAGCLSRHARAALAEGKGYFHGIGSTDGLNKVMKQRGLDQSLKQKSNKLPPLVFKGGNYPI